MLLYDGLTEFDFTDPANPELRPQVAESCESNEDATLWTFRVRDDVTFSNGDPVLPSSFAFAWNRAADPEFASEIAYLFDPIEGAAEQGEGTGSELTGVVADDEAGQPPSAEHWFGTDQVGRDLFTRVVVMRATGVLLAFPYILAAIAIISVVGPGARTVILVLGLLGWLPIQEPTPAWGLMVAQGRRFLAVNPHLLFFPGTAFVFVGDGLRDALDPRLQ